MSADLVTVSGALPSSWPSRDTAPSSVLVVEVSGDPAPVDTSAELRRRRLIEVAEGAGLGVHRVAVESAAAVDLLLDPVVAARRELAALAAVILVGTCLVGAVTTAAMQANDRDLDVLVVADACGAVDEVQRRLAVEALVLQGGVICASAETETVVSSLT